MLDAGKYFLRKQKRSTGIPEKEIIKIAVKSLGLDDLYPFDPDKKIIEYLLKDKSRKSLVDMNLTDFADETASESPAPGGGSISAYVGALGVSLGTMVANLSSHKRGWDDRWEEFSDWAVRGQGYVDELLALVDEDTRAFNGIMAAYRLPEGSEEEALRKAEAVEEAVKRAIEVPLQVMRVSLESMDVMEAMANTGMSASVSDAGVGAVCARAAMRGAYLNVKINAPQLADSDYASTVLAEGAGLLQQAQERAGRIMARVEEVIAASDS
jgi:glutamate formiminotransferase/formiminotetrahydrofolate cyclodeaminase